MLIMRRVIKQLRSSGTLIYAHFVVFPAAEELQLVLGGCQGKVCILCLLL